VVGGSADIMILYGSRCVWRLYTITFRGYRRNSAGCIRLEQNTPQTVIQRELRRRIFSLSISTDKPLTFIPLVRRALIRLKNRGVRSSLQRVVEEISTPTTATGRCFRIIAKGLTWPFSILRAICFRLLTAKLPNRKTLYAFYDLQVEAVSFDFLWFLAGAELARLKYGKERIQVVIVPPRTGLDDANGSDGSIETSATRGPPLAPNSRDWRIHNVLLQAITLLPSAVGGILCADRREASLIRQYASRVYPYGYSVAFPRYHSPGECIAAGTAGSQTVACLRAPPQAQKYVGQWMADRTDGRRVISITLREYAVAPGRNSTKDAWIAFAREISDAGYLPVFVRDTEVALVEDDPIDTEFLVFQEAAWSIPLRAAFYEACYLNMGVNNGPMAICWLDSEVRYLTFKMVSSASSDTTSAAYRARGIEPYQPFSFARPAQQTVWEDDDIQTLRDEFDLVRGIIEQEHTDS